MPSLFTSLPHSVLALQQQLRALGYAPGAIDGVDGPRTRAALLAFQKTAGLAADGIAGPATWAALERASGAAAGPPLVTGCLPRVSEKLVCQMFPASDAHNVAANLPGVLYALQAAQLTTLPLVVTALATIKVEVGTFQPVEEKESADNTRKGGQPFDIYDYNRNLGNNGRPDGCRFRGRGYVQLTGRYNYTHFGPLVGRPDLAEHPDIATDPDIAASLLAAFIRFRQGDIEAALAKDELETVRKLINGGHDGLKPFVDAYHKGMRLLSPIAPA